MNNKNMQDGSIGNFRHDRWMLICDSIILLVFSFFALVAVQLADITISGELTADLLLVIGIIQMAIVLWGVRIRRCYSTWPAIAITILGIEVLLFLVILASTPRSLLTGISRLWISGEIEVIHLQQTPQNENSGKADLQKTSSYDFPGFRGPSRDGVLPNAGLLRNWNYRKPKELWRKNVGSGWSSFAVVGKYCVTQEQRGEYESVVCYELTSGRQCWVHRDRTLFEDEFGFGPRASPTIAHGKVYTLGATGLLNCLAGETGKLIWSVDILDDNHTENCRYGMTGSPLVTEDLVIVSLGGSGSSLAAYHTETGEKIWSRGDGQASYSSPQAAVICGNRQVIIFNGDGLFGHDLKSGEVLWSYDWISHPEERNNVCQPVVLPALAREDRSQIFISSGYGRGCALLEVHKDENDYSIEELWSNRHLKSKFSSVVTSDGHVYGFDERIFTCLDLRTGDRKWRKRVGYGFGQLVLIEDLLFVLSESGNVAMIEADSQQFQLLGRLQALNGRSWNHPVIAGKYLLLRNDREAVCYRLPQLEED